MPEILGVHTILDRALPTGVDGAQLAQWTLRDGTTYEQFVGSLSQALAGFNAELNSKWGYLYAITTEFAVEYPDGSTVTALQEITDLDKPDEIHGSTIGHMIALHAYGGRVGGSRRYWRDARMEQIQSTIATIINRARWRFELDLFTRLFTNTEFAIGSAGYNVPFVRGTGGSVDYTPPAWEGQTFTTSHDHFVGVDDSSYNHDTLLNSLAETVEEHGHEAPFTAIVSRTDVASYQALTKFVEFVAPVVAMIDRGAESSGNQMFARGMPMVTGGVFGYFQSDYGLIELRSSNRIATGYAWLGKSYGVNDPRNPLAVRVHPTDGFGAYMVPETTLNREYPVQRLTIEMEHGVGVGRDRTNGAVGYLVVGGSYTNPTIS
jgi:hypothetical protein